MTTDVTSTNIYHTLLGDGEVRDMVDNYDAMIEVAAISLASSTVLKEGEDCKVMLGSIASELARWIGDVPDYTAEMMKEDVKKVMPTTMIPGSRGMSDAELEAPLKSIMEDGLKALKDRSAEKLDQKITKATSGVAIVHGIIAQRRISQEIWLGNRGDSEEKYSMLKWVWKTIYQSSHYRDHKEFADEVPDFNYTTCVEDIRELMMPKRRFEDLIDVAMLYAAHMSPEYTKSSPQGDASANIADRPGLSERAATYTWILTLMVTYGPKKKLLSDKDQDHPFAEIFAAVPPGGDRPTETYYYSNSMYWGEKLLYPQEQRYMHHVAGLVGGVMARILGRNETAQLNKDYGESKELEKHLTGALYFGPNIFTGSLALND